MMLDANITPEDRRSIVVGAATAALSALLSGAVAWGFEEAKRLLAERRERRKTAASEGSSP